MVVGHQAGTCWVIFPAGNGADWATFPADSVYQPRDSRPSSVEPEAMDTGALASSLAAESEEVSEGSSEVEDFSSAESGPAHSGPAKGGTGGRSGTAAGTKCKPEVGPTLPWSKTKNLRARLESTLVYQLERFSLNVLILYLESQWCPRFCHTFFLHFIYFATMVACYSIPGFNPKEITQSFKFIRTLSRFI